MSIVNSKISIESRQLTIDNRVIKMEVVMKKTNLYVSVLTCLSFIVPFISDGQWVLQSSGTSNDLNGVFFYDAYHGWAVGDSGVILNTSDGGETWNQQTSGTSLDLCSVCFINQDKGWITGKLIYPDSGIILRTLNGGNNWDLVFNPPGTRMVDIFFIDSLNGWAVGEVDGWYGTHGSPIFFSSNGGQTWDQISGLYEIKSIQFMDENNGWAAGGSVSGSTGYPYTIMFLTSDGGNTWVEKISNQGTGLLGVVYFIDQDVGWAAGGNPGLNGPTFSTILYTTNGGESWVTQNSLSNRVLTDICFTDLQNGWAIGGYTSVSWVPDSSVILHTENRGADWQIISSPSPEQLNSLCFPEPDKGWIVGCNGTIMNYSPVEQFCLPQGITFTDQAQIDSFHVNYPGCTGIEGDVVISGDSISNLTGLNGLTFIGGNLSIQGNNALTSVTGLDDLAIIGGNLQIDSNASLTRLTGLNKIYANSISDLVITNNGNLSTCDVQSICDYLAAPNGNVVIHSNATGCNSVSEVEEDCANNCLPDGIFITSQSQIDSFHIIYPECTEIGGLVHIAGEVITNLNGLSPLTSVCGNMVIGDNFGANSFLSSLTGLDSLVTIEGSLEVRHNDILTNLMGLDNLTTIGKNISIYDNHALTNLTGLESMNYLAGNLSIGIYFLGGNFSLTDLTGLDSLTSIGGNLSIEYNNALTNLTGLETLTHVGASLALRSNDALIDLTALENVTAVGGQLSIDYNNELSSLTGLEGLNSLGGGLSVSGNYFLTSLKGLDGLTSIGGDLVIKWNYELISLTELEGLTSIGGDLFIASNYDLTSLMGLNNIDAGSISALYISQNPELSTCHVQSICDYLATPNGDIDIQDNAPGCNSQMEVEEACGISSVNKFQVPGSGFRIEVYPNPAADQVSVRYFLPVPSSRFAVRSNLSLKIYDLFGREVRTLVDEVKSPGEYTVRMDVSDLPAGVYLVRLQAGGQSAVRKLVVK